MARESAARAMCPDQRDILIGRVGSPFGIGGEVKVVVTTDFPERLSQGARLAIRPAVGEMLETLVERSRPVKGYVILKLAGIDTRTDARQLVGAEIVIQESELRALEEGRFYVFDIIGLKVRTDDGRELGEITEVLQGGGNDVYVTSDGLCIPALKDVVSRIDIHEGVMVIRPVPGLLPEE
ncbi:MAG: ribosome maturation factor RimM [Acidobacteriota bacterium]